MNFLVQVLISVALSVVAYIITPKSKTDKPAAAEDMDAPTADAGRPVPVVFGTVTITGLNILGYWDKSTVEREVDT